MDRNPQKFVNIYKAADADFQKATERVYHSASLTSQLKIRRIIDRRISLSRTSFLLIPIGCCQQKKPERDEAENSVAYVQGSRIVDEDLSDRSEEHTSELQS